MMVEEVSEIRRRKFNECFVGDEEEFILDTMFGREPEERLEERGNMVSGASASE